MLLYLVCKPHKNGIRRVEATIVDDNDKIEFLINGEPYTADCHEWHFGIEAAKQHVLCILSQVAKETDFPLDTLVDLATQRGWFDVTDCTVSGITTREAVSA